MLLPIFKDRSAAAGDVGGAIIRTISSRRTFSGIQILSLPRVTYLHHLQVIVDMRDFVVPPTRFKTFSDPTLWDYTLHLMFV